MTCQSSVEQGDCGEELNIKPRCFHSNPILCIIVFYVYMYVNLNEMNLFKLTSGLHSVLTVTCQLYTYFAQSNTPSQVLTGRYIRLSSVSR